MSKKILFIFLSGIGNFILFTPTLRAIRRRFPKAEITLLAKQKVITDIIKDKSIVDHIIHYPKSASGSRNFTTQFSLAYRLRKKKYDLVVTTFDSRGWKLDLFIWMTAGKFSIGYKTGRWFDNVYDKLLTDISGLHEVDRHLKIADFLGADVKDKMLEIFVSDEDRRFAEKVIPQDIKLIIGMHPGSSENLWRKRWMPERFAELADRLSERYGAKILILGGKDEVNIAKKISALMQTAKPLVMAGKTTIGQAAALIEQCALFVSNDSGLMHVAAAIKTPVVAIFGPTDPAKNAPYGKDHIVVRKGIACSPCLTYDKDGCKCPACMEAVTVDDVLDAIKKQINLSTKINK